MNSENVEATKFRVIYCVLNSFFLISSTQFGIPLIYFIVFIPVCGSKSKVQIYRVFGLSVIFFVYYHISATNKWNTKCFQRCCCYCHFCVLFVFQLTFSSNAHNYRQHMEFRPKTPGAVNGNHNDRFPYECLFEL